jgi:Tol biopolymer transport system component
MKARMFRWIAIGLIDSIPAQGSGAEPPGIAATSPDQDLPPHITRLTPFGERADFSPDSQRVLFVEKTFGDVYEVEIQTRIPRLLTGFYPQHYKASNPVVSDDGRFLAFQMARSRDPAGVGYGIFLFDLSQAGYGKEGK